MKQALITAAILLGLTACSPDDPQRRLDQDFGPKPLFDPIVLPTNTRGAILPLPIDLVFGRDASGADGNPDNDADGTLAPSGTLAALPDFGLVDGWSTTASLFFNLQGDVDINTAAAGVRIFDSRTARELIPGEDFSLQLSPVSIGSARVVVNWLKPLNESTRYLIGLTRDLRSPGGGEAVPSELFDALNRKPDIKFSEQTDNTLKPALEALGRSDLIPQLDDLKASFVTPIVAGLQQISAASPNSRGAITPDDLVLAWSFTTQSITPTLKSINDNAASRTLAVQPTGKTVADVLGIASGLPASQNPEVYAGLFSLPYYQQQGAEHILDSHWLNDGVVNDTGVNPANGAPCGALPIQPKSTTLCYPHPQVQADINVPVLLTRPQSQMPEGGWPVVVFLHGIKGNRSNLLPIAGALSTAGLVGIAIDQPLHGITLDSQRDLRVPGTTERTFDADLDQDGTVDASGAHFINLEHPVTSRDNIRQSVADQIHLVRSLGNLRLGTDGSETINTDRIYFLGHSLGGIVGGTLLGVNQDIKAASLAMPGGGIGKLLDASPTFGPRIAAGLADKGIQRDSDTFEIFLRFAQLSVDAADPINWASSAATDRALQVIEVIDDQVVPNTATENVFLPGLLSGTEPLAIAQGLSPTAITPPVDTPQVLSGSQWIQFNGGSHSSILKPSTEDNPADDPVFVEMQRQVASFLASNGACLPIGGNCPSAR